MTRAAIALGTVATSLALGCSYLLDGQPDELQAERDTAAQVAEVGAEHVALLRAQHPSVHKPVHRRHPSTQLADASEGAR